MRNRVYVTAGRPSVSVRLSRSAAARRFGGFAGVHGPGGQEMSIADSSSRAAAAAECEQCHVVS